MSTIETASTAWPAAGTTAIAAAFNPTISGQTLINQQAKAQYI
jgi:hypothetical protein